MNGYRTEIFEMHSAPGGLCTSWKRKGYVFDGCIHHLAGCKPEYRLYEVWKDLGAMPRAILCPQEIVEVVAEDGKKLTVFSDIERLEQHMNQLAPINSDRPAGGLLTGGAGAYRDNRCGHTSYYGTLYRQCSVLSGKRWCWLA